MILDFRTEPVGSDVAVDLCVVGAGAAGISIAHRLLGSGVSVCLVESGGLDFCPDVQNLYAGESVGHPVVPDVGRYRQFGGSTNRWTGRCAWLDPIDFEARPWVSDITWPVGYDDVAKFYPDAERLCGFSEPWAPAAAIPANVGRGSEGFGSDQIDRFVWRYAAKGRRRYMNWGLEYRQLLSEAPNCLTILNANLVQYEVDDGSDTQSVRAITIASLTGQQRKIRARAFVLCCGGIENVRLLLQSAESTPYGLGNRYDQVGRYFMQHPRGRTADLTPTAASARRLQQMFNIFPANSGIQFETGFALSAEAQRRAELLNCSGILVYDEYQQSPWWSAKEFGRALRNERDPGHVIRHAMLAAKRPDIIAGNLLRHLRTHEPPQLALSRIGLQVDLEQVSDPDSRITLGEKRDVLGQRAVRIDWRVADLERRTARLFTEYLVTEFRRLDLGEIHPRAWLYESGPVTADCLAGNFHHIGGTRMSANPRSGVVDANSRVHGTSNLFVSGCSVFTTGGHANPTLTIVALALRLADHLKSEFGPDALGSGRSDRKEPAGTSLDAEIAADAARPAHEPAVSVLMACSDNRDHVGSAVLSVLKQTIHDLELIVVDDASTDGSTTVLRALTASDRRVRLITLPYKAGSAAARNHALAVARGRWIAIVDADDLLSRGRLEQLLATAEREGVDLVADNQMMFSGDDGRSAAMLSNWSKPRPMALAEFIRSTVRNRRTAATGVLKPVFRAEILRKTGIRYNPDMGDAGDCDFLMRLMAEGARLLVTPEPWYLYREPEGSVWGRPSKTAPSIMQAALRNFEQRYGAKLNADERRAVQALDKSYKVEAARKVMQDGLKRGTLLEAFGVLRRSPSILLDLWYSSAACLQQLRALFRKQQHAWPNSVRPDLVKPQVCLLTRQRLVGKTNGSSVYLLGIVEALRNAGCDVHLMCASPAMFGRWGWIRLRKDMDVFASIRVRRGFRVASYLVATDMRPWLGMARGLLGRLLSSAGIQVPALTRRAPYNVAVPWKHADRLFVTSHRPARVDAVLCDYAFLAEGAHHVLNPCAPVAILQHDLFQTWSTQAVAKDDQNRANLIDAATEWSLLSLADAVISIQESEAAAVRQALPHQRVIVAPVAANAVPAAQPGKCGTALFVGSNTVPNAQGVEWLLSEVWPLVRQKDPDAVLDIAGSVCQRISLVPEGVRLLGLVPDLAPLYSEAAVVVSPLQVGSGLKVKLVEAMAAGKAIVATPVTMQGVEELGGRAVLVESTPDCFAAAVLLLLRDRDRRVALANEALAVAEERFSAAACYRETVSFLTQTATAKMPEAPPVPQIEPILAVQEIAPSL